MKLQTTQSTLLQNIFVAFVAIALCLAIIGQPVHAAPGSAKAEGKVFRIGFHLWKPGRIYEEAMQGITDGLKLAKIPYEEVVLHSDRSKELAAKNLEKLDKMGLDLIYSLSSAGTKIARQLSLQTPVIATVINHPASLGMDGTSSEGATQITGSSYYVDAEKQLKLYKRLFPEMKRVGMIFDKKNPAGRLAEEPFMRAACKAAGVEFHSIGIESDTEIETASRQLVEAKVDMVVVPTNRLVYGNLDSVLAITTPANIAVVSMSKQGVENGALAGLFADTYDLGREAAEIGKKVLHQGQKAGDIKFSFVAEPDVIVNLNSATSLGFVFPPEVLGSAAIVLQ